MSMYPDSGARKPWELDYANNDKTMSKFFNVVYAWMAVGLALTAHNNGTIASAVFDHVTLTQMNPTGLGTPTALTVAHVAPFKSLSGIIVSWRPGSDNESGFKVERSTDGVNFTPQDFSSNCLTITAPASVPVYFGPFRIPELKTFNLESQTSCP